jgi:hypothetical protein
MTRSYIGIATRAGLESFQPENEVAAQLIAQRVYCARPLKGMCCWAVLGDAAAAEVIGLIARGDRRAALVTIDRTASHLGPIFPENSARILQD